MSCLFVSVAKKLFDTGIERIDHEDLRQNVCAYIEHSNPTVLDDMSLEAWIKMDSDMEKDQYAQRMRDVSCWGGAIELWCLANMYKIDFGVVLNGSEINIGPTAMCAQAKLGLNYTGAHYTPR